MDSCINTALITYKVKKLKELIENLEAEPIKKDFDEFKKIVLADLQRYQTLKNTSLDIQRLQDTIEITCIKFMSIQIGYYLKTGSIELAKNCYELIRDLSKEYYTGKESYEESDVKEFTKQRQKIVIALLSKEHKLPKDDYLCLNTVIGCLFTDSKTRKLNRYDKYKDLGSYITDITLRQLNKYSLNTEIFPMVEFIEKDIPNTPIHNLRLSSIYYFLTTAGLKDFSKQMLYFLDKANSFDNVNNENNELDNINFKNALLSANVSAIMHLASRQEDYQKYIQMIEKIEGTDSKDVQEFKEYLKSIKIAQEFSKQYIEPEESEDPPQELPQATEQTTKADYSILEADLPAENEQANDLSEVIQTEALLEDIQKDPETRIMNLVSYPELFAIKARISQDSELNVKVPPNAFNINGTIYIPDSPDVVELEEGLYAAIDKNLILDTILRKQLQQSLEKGIASSNTANGIKITKLEKECKKAIGYYIKHGRQDLRIQARYKYHNRYTKQTLIIFDHAVNHTKNVKNLQQGTLITQTEIYIPPSSSKDYKPDDAIERGGAAAAYKGTRETEGAGKDWTEKAQDERQKASKKEKDKRRK